MPTIPRRTILGGGAAALAAPAPAADRPVDVAAVLDVNDLDRRIWQEELDEFVPKRMWDMHSHLGLDRFNLDPARDQSRGAKLSTGALEKVSTMQTLRQCNAILYPGREVIPFVLPFPHRQCDCLNQNEWAAAQVKNSTPRGVCTMVVKPDLPAALVDQQVRKHRFIGFKPYMWYAGGENWRQARITDFLIEPHLEVANQYGLIMALHVAKRLAISDPENLADMERLTRKYPRLRWLLLHNARSYSAWAIEKAAPRLRDLPNLWFESSSVCEADSFFVTFSQLGTHRFCYGSDDIPVGITRGKYIAWGYGWEQLDSNNFSAKPTHCDGRMTFVRYEMLRAIRRAARYAGLSRAQIEDVFYGNGNRLVTEARADLEKALR